MKAQDIRNADYLDILFDNRNKKYGSYALRKHHDRTLMRSLLLMVGLCACFLASGFLPNKKVAQDIEPPRVVCTLTTIDPPVLPPDPPEQVQPEPPASKPTVQNTIPKIAPDDIVTELPQPVDSFDGRESGPATVAGNPDGQTVANTNTAGGGTAPVTASNHPVDYTEVMPEFEGNVYAYLNKAIHYPTRAVQAGIQGRVLVQFVVNKDGSIGDVTVARGIGGGCDEEAVRVVSNMPPWKPGLHQGKPVRVNFRLPITFKLE